MATNNVTNASPAVPLTGATMTGPLILSANPVNPLEAATKDYVDTYQNIAMGGVSGNWYFSNNGFMQEKLQGSPSSKTIATGTLIYLAYFVGKKTVYTDIAISINTTAAGTSVMGIYESDPTTPRPIGSPITGSASGSITNVVSTLSSFTFSTPITLNPGIYWLAASVSATNAIFGTNDTFAAGELGFIAPVPTGTVQYGWNQAFSYSATLPAVGTLTAMTTTGNIIFIFLKAQ